MRSIVFSTVSHLDMYTGEDRKDRWRPLLELLRIHDFKVDRLNISSSATCDRTSSPRWSRT